MVSRRSADTATDRRTKFVAEYLIDLNATQAAIRAGYSPKTAVKQGSRLLTIADVQAAISKGRAKQQERTEIYADRVIKEAARLAFFDIRKLCDAQGNPIPIQSLDSDTAAAIQGIETVQIGGEDGPAIIKKYKIADKNAALERLFKHLGLFEKDNKQNNPTTAITALLEMVNGSKLPVAK